MGYRTEAGRALNILKQIQSESRRDRDLRGDRGRHEKSMQDFAKRVSKAKTVEEALALTRAAYQPTLWDQWREYWINGLLSGPWTHLVNITSNALYTALESGSRSACRW